MDRRERAWAAGFFDGEGWAGLVVQAGRRTTQPQAQINQAGTDGVPETLVRFQRAVGVGRITGPTKIAGRKDLYRWCASSRDDVRRVCEALAPWLGGVKLAQFECALGLSVSTPQNVTESDEWVAWAAGLYDGEGCSALLRHRTHEGHFIPELSVTQSSSVGSPEVLVRFTEIVRAGGISGPYTQRSSTKAVFRWKASSRDDAVGVLNVLWPFLGSVKRAQAQRVLDVLTTQPVLPRGNPAWGNNKTMCVNGHDYATARIRAFVPRKGGTPPRDNSGCLACLREYARRRREMKRSAGHETSGSIDGSQKDDDPTC